MQIIAMAGLAQCGKTTLANKIAQVAYESGMLPKMMSFAGSLKRAAKEIGADKTLRPQLYRKFCQQVGGLLRDPEYVKGVTGPDYWVNLTMTEIKAYAAEETKRLEASNNPDFAAGRLPAQPFRETVLIFDDVRFQNELDMLKKVGAVTIYVDRETELPEPNADFRKDVSEKLAYDMKADGDLRSRNFNYTVASVGSIDAFLTRVGPFIPVWLGLADLGLPGTGE